MAPHRRGSLLWGCGLIFAATALSLGSRSFSLISGAGSSRLLGHLCRSSHAPGVVRQAEDPFAQRGGIAAADLQVREPEVEKRRFVERPQRSRRHERSSLQRDGAINRGRKSFKARRQEEEEEEVNLTREEREERFRQQIHSPVTLTTFIKRAQTPEEFMWTLWTAMDETMLNHIHLAAAFTQLAALKKKAAPFSDRIRKSPLLVEMAKQAARVADRREFRAREIANMLIAAASLRTEFPWIGDVLGVPLAKWVPQNVPTMTPQAFANTIYGLGVLNLGNEKEVTDAIRSCAQAIPVQLGRFSSQDVAQVAWGLGARESAEEAGELLDAIEKWVLAEAGSMSVQAVLLDLPMIAVAFARLGDWRADMMDAIARRIYPVMQELRLWSLAALLWVWTHPSSPYGGQSEMHANFPELEKSKRKFGSNFDEGAMARLFLGRLRKDAKRRKITEEDIERAPTGPKGETSEIWSRNFWKKKRPTAALEP